MPEYTLIDQVHLLGAFMDTFSVLDTSGHRPLWEQPDEFVDYMVGTVLRQTTPTG